MILYPSTLARDAALTALPAAAWTGSHRTFTEFAMDLDRLLPCSDADLKPRPEARGVGRFALLAQAARLDADELERVAGSERAIQSAGALIASWKAASLRPDDIRAAAADLSRTPDSARVGRIAQRLARLYELYERQLGGQWMDREAGERALLRRLEACNAVPSRLLKAGESVTLLGFHKLPYIQFRIVEKLIRLNHAVSFQSAIFDHAAEAARYPGLRKTFGSARNVPGVAAPAKSIARMEAPSPYAEVYEIGRRVRRWITDEGVKPASIAVTFRDLGPYSQAVHDVFRRLEIPFYERRGEPAQFQPLVRVALSAIDACVAALDRRSVFRFLCAGPVNVAALAGSPRTAVDPDALRALALDAGIDAAPDALNGDASALWRTKLKRFATDVSDTSAGSKSQRPPPKGRAKLARALIAIIERLNGLRAPRTAHAHVQAWRAFFDVCGLSAATLADAKGALPLKDRLAVGALNAALASVAEIPDAAAEQISIETFAELLNTAIQDQSVRAEGLERAGVHVLNFYDLRGLTFERVVIGGLAEGLCPARPGSDPLLGQGAERALRDALKTRVNDREAAAYLAPRLSHETDEEERALFEGALACARGELLLTRPEQGFNGGAAGASEYWEKFDAPPQKSMPIHPAPTLVECITAEESELRAAWILGGGATSSASESRTALEAFANAPRLKALARSAAVERARYQFFLDQAIAAAQTEKGVSSTVQADAAGLFDGVMTAMLAEASAPETTAAAVTTFNAMESAVAKRLATRGIGDPVLGPSDLEKLAACPFRFFLERVCRFDQKDEPGNEVSPLDVGDLWHVILNRFYTEELERAERAGAVTAQLNPKLRAAYLDRLLFFAGEELQKTSAEHFVGHPGFWKLQDVRLRALLGLWLDCELQESNGFYPARVEFAFGPEPESGVRELTVPLHAGSRDTAVAPALRIKGRMDRLDFKVEKRDGVDTIVAVRVIDYKLGRGEKYKSKTKLGGLASLLSAQLPIYLAAAVDYLFVLRDEKNIAVDFESVWTESRGGYYALRDTPFSSRGERARLIEVKEWPLGSLRDFLNTAAPDGSGALFDLARQHIAAVLSGRFPVQPLDCAGLYCPSRYACRYQAIPAMEEED